VVVRPCERPLVYRDRCPTKPETSKGSTQARGARSQPKACVMMPGTLSIISQTTPAERMAIRMAPELRDNDSTNLFISLLHLPTDLNCQYRGSLDNLFSNVILQSMPQCSTDCRMAIVILPARLEVQLPCGRKSSQAVAAKLSAPLPSRGCGLFPRQGFRFLCEPD
jgi:hypothetical protein